MEELETVRRPAVVPEPQREVQRQAFPSADDATLISALLAERNATASPVIAVGGSLAGSLAFAIRVKYPSLVDMALASSAPILGYPGLADPYGWYAVATATAEAQAPGCSARVRDAFSALDAANASQITRAYNACTPIAPAQLRDVVWRLNSRLTGQLASAAESAYPAATSPSAAACAALANGSGVAAFRPLLVPPGECLNVSSLLSAASHGGIDID